MPKEPLQPKDHAEEVALFRAEVIGDLKHLAQEHGALALELQARSKRRYRPPGAEATRTYAVPTLERWYYAYKAGGLSSSLFDGHQPLHRSLAALMPISQLARSPINQLAR